MLDRLGMSSCKGVSTPIASFTVLSSVCPLDPSFSDPTKYRQVVGALQYVTLTRPDLAFVVNRVCQFMHDPHDSHWDVVKRILWYLQTTKDQGLVIRPFTSLTVQAFSDADWAGSTDDRRSTGGYAVYFGTNLVSWQ
ncbi:hypothetical protein LIER_08723 [Lithospermum erythrorhizon]|uniref:Mitochondrial protein n=1 Tax=Lithospermum erythrorhizon TaxID=34254 RepID=A0AAV3PH05_LITER